MYEDPLIDESVHGNANVSKESPVKTMVKLLISFALILIVSYMLLMFAVHQAVNYISFETEKRWFGAMSEPMLQSYVTVPS